MQTIAVLITCHNRRDKTLACLTALLKIDTLADFNLEVFLVDDGSTDGSSNAIKNQFPTVHLIRGSGDLYWNGGMRVAFDVAMQKSFDFYLWLNDDTILYPGALSSLLALAKVELLRQGIPSIIVGTTQDSISGAATYGGLCRRSVWQPLSHQLIFDSTEATPCETMNGNCVLLPGMVARQLGNLEPAFVHAMGDIDYGLRAKKSGVPLIVLPGYVGVCSHNPIDNTFMDHRLGLKMRWSKIMGTKGLPPRQWYVLVRRHAGMLWPLLFAWPYVKVVLNLVR